MNKVFIQANNKQMLGAILAKYAIKKNHPGQIEVQIMNVDEISIFKDFSGKEYLRKGRLVKYDPNDLQSFTLTRFMPPELMNFEGKACVIDPDIFALCDIDELFNLEMNEASILACTKKDAFDTSVMILDCKKLKHLKIKNIIDSLENKKLDYDDIMTLRNEKNVLPLNRIYNNLDFLNEETRLLHTTNRLTQPWKKGLKIDFTMNPLPKIFGVIKREPIYKIFGKIKKTYKEHPDRNIENFFFDLAKSALKDGFIKKEDILKQIEEGNIRKDFLEKINS